ncbi:cupin domain-containing protein [Ruania suaedae]|uniref:cupin domain-containing protein n=1 Tax=Ruania suaedae TaxID=2897774 RepID=UPI001E627E2C|nr:cupin domain-containing protein [Ruania suaedae]UFU01827.1 cupin domain-containing protein [Ruania suaedae]
MAEMPTVKDTRELTAYRITAEDTVVLCPLTGPVDGSPTSVFFEVWDPLGVQSDNSHPASVEIFFIVQGEGLAQSDEHRVSVSAGDVLVLPATSVHHIQNTSATERLYAVTIMCHDLGSQPQDSPMSGFYELVTAGVPVELDAQAREVFHRNAGRIASFAAAH